MKMLSQFLIASTTWIVLLHPIQGLAQEDDDDSRNDESFRPSPAPRRPTFPHCFAKVVNMRYGLSQFGVSAILQVEVEGEPQTARQVFVRMEGHSQSNDMMVAPIFMMASGIASPGVTSLRLQSSGNLLTIGSNQQITDLDVVEVKCFPQF